MQLSTLVRALFVLLVSVQLFLVTLVEGMHHHHGYSCHQEMPVYESHCEQGHHGSHLGHIMMAGMMGKMMSKYSKMHHMRHRMMHHRKHKHIPVIIPIPIHHHSPPAYHHESYGYGHHG